MNRVPLPNRRMHEAFRFSHWGQSYIVGVGRANSAAPITEVFLNCAKSGEQSQTLARDSAVLLSLALQYGVPLEVIGHAITRDSDGKPAGPIGTLVDLMEEPA
ncbi:MAG: hypothetical protein V4477_16960 [Pseudomonadota bacterium]